MQNLMPELFSPQQTSRDVKKVDLISKSYVTNIGDIFSKHRGPKTPPKDVECLIHRVISDRDVPKLACDYLVEDSVSSSYTIIGNKYVLLDTVEGSSMYKCVDIRTKEEYVCKVVPHTNYSMVGAHYRLDSNSRIASLHEVIVQDKHLYLFFPRTYGDLHSYVRSRKRLRESEAKRLFKQIVETVQVCHENGIVLRDLKLRKFVFTDPERTQLRLESLEDAVVLEDNSDLLHDKRGCPAYVSPEILKVGANYSGKAADMWSLGVIMYTMLVGRYPFNDPDHTVLFAKITKGHFVIPDCISSRARCLIRSLLRKEPSERLVSEDILFHPWLAKEDRDWQARACDQLVPESCFYDGEDQD
ncbi:tribbles homolog 2 isoform X1 [Onthophagus taurus]|uniref:tribbles homolog 2 isoform X1 n=1 Tax=Onthophagus taurus TaxID=166361 RepID=UPI0039BE70DE